MAENSSEAAKPKRRRGPGRPFAPGVSGNPGGRPKAYADFQELCRARSPKALETLDAALDAGDVTAARVLLEYAWGKPPSAPGDLEAQLEVRPFAGLSLEELRELATKAEE